MGLSVLSKQLPYRVEGYGIRLNDEGYGVTTRSGTGSLMGSSASVQDGAWHHIAFTYQPGEFMSLYVDGGAPAATRPSSLIESSPGELIFGGFDGGEPVGWFHGRIDDAQVYDFALSQAEVNFLKEHPGQTLPTQPLVWMLPAGGDYTEAVSVTLGTSVEGGQIHYTLDGSDPTTMSPRYEGPIRVLSTTEIRVRVFREDQALSPVESAHFTVPFAEEPTGRLLAYWRFDRVHGRVVVDEVGNHHGFLSPYASGYSPNGIDGPALSLDRATGYGYVVVGRVLPLTDAAFSLSLWMRFNTAERPINRVLISKHQPGEAGGYYLMLGPLSDDPPTVQGYAGDGVLLKANRVVGDGAWHHVVMTHDARGVSKLYIDGGAPQASAQGLGPLPASRARLILGGMDEPLTTGMYDGLIDDIQIYDFALSERQVEHLRSHPGQPFSGEGISPVQIIPPGGTFSAGVDVILHASHSGATLRYTTDGSEPESQSPIYGGPIRLTQSGSVKVRRWVGNSPDAAVTTAEFVVIPDPVPTGPLIGHWRFDEDSAGTAFDETGRYDGILSPAGVYRSPDGVSGKAISLQPSENGYVLLPKSLPQLEHAFSLSAWFRAGTSFRTAHLFSRHKPGADDGVSLALGGDDHGPLIGASPAPFWVSSPAVVRDFRWHHIVLYREPLELTGSARLQARQYVNGLAVSDVASVEFTVVNEEGGRPPTGLLLAHWRMETLAGGIAVDETGLNPGLVSSGGAFLVADGVAGGALALVQGANGYVRGGNALPLTNTAFTLSLWVKYPQGEAIPAANILSKFRSWSSGGYHLSLGQGGNSVVAQFGDGPVVGGQLPAPDGGWHHLAVTCTEYGRLRIYWDGTAPVADGQAGKILPTTAELVLGGIDQGAPVGSFTGFIDDVQVYGFALSEAEVNRLRQHPGEPLDDIALPPVQILPEGGSFDRAVEVLLKGSVPGAVIRYTLDGRAPDGDSAVYTDKVVLSSPVLFRAAAFLEAIQVGSVVEAFFDVQLPPGPGLLAHWRMDDISGWVASDDVGNYPGRLSSTGAGFVSNGLSGGALALNRSQSGHVVLGDVLGFTTHAFSISLWFNTALSGNSSNSVLFSKHPGGGTNGYYIALNLVNPIQAYLGEGSVVASPRIVQPGRWYHLVLCHQPGGRAQLYLDGIQAPVDAPGFEIQATTAPALIGAIAADPVVGGFHGMLDDIQVYGFALKQSEVQSLYESPGFALGAELSAAPTIEPPGGVFSTPVTATMTMNSEVSGATLRFTTNGLPPNAQSRSYGGPIVFGSSVALRAAGFLGPRQVTRVARADWNIRLPVPPRIDVAPESRTVAVSSAIICPWSVVPSRWRSG